MLQAPHPQKMTIQYVNHISSLITPINDDYVLLNDEYVILSHIYINKVGVSGGNFP